MLTHRDWAIYPPLPHNPRFALLVFHVLDPRTPVLPRSFCPHYFSRQAFSRQNLGLTWRVEVQLGYPQSLVDTPVTVHIEGSRDLKKYIRD